MRYLFLLLVLCCLFGILDSVPRLKVDMYSGFPHTASGPASVSPLVSTPGLSTKSAALGREGYSERTSMIKVPQAPVRETKLAQPKASVTSGQISRQMNIEEAAPVNAGSGIAAKAENGKADGVAKAENGKADGVAKTDGPAKTEGEIGEMPAVGDSIAIAQSVVRSSDSVSSADSVEAVKTVETVKTIETVKTVETVSNREERQAQDLALSPSENLDKSVDALFTGLKASVSIKKANIHAAPLTAIQQAMVDSIRNRLMNPQGLQFIGSAGLNWAGARANTSGSGHVRGKPLNGFDLGLSADIPLNKHWSFRPKAEYSYEGFRPDVNGTAVDIHVAYLSLPLDMVYHSDWISRRFFAGAGPYLARALSGTYNFKGIDTDMGFGNHYASGDNLRSMDYGIHLMAGLLLDKNFVFGAQAKWGLSNIAPSGTGSEIHTRSGGLFLMYVFRK
jgi:hypothetical protein